MNDNSIYKNGHYFNNNPTWSVEDSPWKARKIVEMLEKHKIEPKTICEVGCGVGEILSQLYHQLPDHVEYHGYEISPQAYDLCQQRKEDRIHFHLKELKEEKDVNFDVIMAIDVFEHVEDYLTFLRDLRKKATFKIFHIPLGLSVQTVLRDSCLVDSWEKVGHLHNFTEKTALTALRYTGYEIVDHFFTEHGIELPSSSLKRNIMRIPRGILAMINKSLAARLLGGSSLLVLAK
ncbi:MAG: class I SAM-dependent methyltransferase [Planctomycetes bacterium]|nr:class I SAM-dependent methyltransferase [Planctomycetota bacterium]